MEVKTLVMWKNEPNDHSCKSQFQPFAPYRTRTIHMVQNTVITVLLRIPYRIVMAQHWHAHSTHQPYRIVMARHWHAHSTHQSTQYTNPPTLPQTTHNSLNPSPTRTLPTLLELDSFMLISDQRAEHISHAGSCGQEGIMVTVPWVQLAWSSDCSRVDARAVEGRSPFCSKEGEPVRSLKSTHSQLRIFSFYSRP